MINPYRIIDRLNATSFLVEDSQGRRASLQMLRGHAASRHSIARCFTEVCVAASIGHPGIQQVHDVGRTDDDEPFIVGELLTAPTLATRLRRGPLPLRDALAAARAIALVLAAAHERGVAHGSLSPDVIRFDGNAVKLTGFGLASLGDDRGVLPLYTSPEQCRVAPSHDERSDLYSLGCVLVAMLTGKPPFQSASANELRNSHLLAPPPALRGPAAPFVARLLAKNPDARPASATEVAATLAGLLQALEPEPIARPLPWLLAAALAITAVISIGYGVRKEIDRISPVVFHELQRASLSP